MTEICPRCQQPFTGTCCGGLKPRTQKSWIQTYTGGQFWPLDPYVGDVRIVDIAHALSNLCRFTGHCAKFYSVAEHCVRVSFRCEELAGLKAEQFFTNSPDLSKEEARLSYNAHERGLARWGLLHDAAEAYVNDLARPLKHQPELTLYREAEKRIQAVICEKFGLPLEEPAEIHQADGELLFTERRDLFLTVHPEWDATAKSVYTPLAHVQIAAWAPEKAKRIFIRRFAELFPEHVTED